MPIAIPTPRFVFNRLGFTWLYHITKLAALDGIIKSITARPGDWAQCELDLVATPGWDFSANRWLRDYSVLDFELKLGNRGAYTYFFADAPSRWGLAKNIGADASKPLEEQGLGTLRVRVEDLLARYDGPLFLRPDDRALVIRGGYKGPGEARPIAVNQSGMTR